MRPESRTPARALARLPGADRRRRIDRSRGARTRHGGGAVPNVAEYGGGTSSLQVDEGGSTGLSFHFYGLYHPGLPDPFLASIDWGDQSSSEGTVSRIVRADGTPVFVVSGTHTYYGKT